jgi:ABC-type multidrug transport system fused ATPase/permease subunit
MTQQAPASAPRQAGLQTILRFLPLLWPKGEGELKARVIAALVLVLAGKAIALAMPFAYKAVVDGMSAERQAAGAVLMLVVAYAAARFGGVLADNLRNAVFEKVGQQAGRRLAARVFRHIHNLSLRFHLERRTGSLTKIVERGTKSIDMMLYFLLFNIALYRIHPLDHRLAREGPARDERGRQPRDRPRRRQPAELRDGQIFRRRGARGAAL